MGVFVARSSSPTCYSAGCPYCRAHEWGTRTDTVLQAFYAPRFQGLKPHVAPSSRTEEIPSGVGSLLALLSPSRLVGSQDTLAQLSARSAGTASPGQSGRTA